MLRNTKWRHLSSNELRVRREADPCEPKEIRLVFAKSPYPLRWSIGINTYYPELPGGSYSNYGMVLDVICVLSESGIFFVWEDNCSNTELFLPEPIIIFNEERYIVFHGSNRAGFAYAWESLKSSSGFLDSSLVIDFCTTYQTYETAIDAISKLGYDLRTF